MTKLSSRKVVFRTEGGTTVGLGHVMRCLALADEFSKRGHHCRFAGTVPDFITHRLTDTPTIHLDSTASDWKNHEFVEDVTSSDLLVTDHYNIDVSWQNNSPVPVLAITDPPLDEQSATLTLLPTDFTTETTKTILTAPAHTLIGNEFRAFRRKPKSGRRILVSCGGGNDAGLTQLVLKALRSSFDLMTTGTTVVIGMGEKANVQNIQKMAATIPNVHFVEREPNMAQQVSAHDIAIGTPAGSALERCCLGLAQILIPIAENQIALGNALADKNAALVLPEGANPDDIATAASKLFDDNALRSKIASNAFHLVDGCGASRVVDVVEERIFAR